MLVIAKTPVEHKRSIILVITKDIARTNADSTTTPNLSISPLQDVPSKHDINVHAGQRHSSNVDDNL